MAGYVYGIGAERVVVLVLSEVGDDEVEMGVRCCLSGREIGAGDGGRAHMGKDNLIQFDEFSLTISYDGSRAMDIKNEYQYE